MQTIEKQIKLHILIQWLLVPIVIIVIGLGWKYYWLGFIVPVVMLIGMLSPLLNRGRYVCGNWCPRGAFYDRILRRFSRELKIPNFLRNAKFRWLVFGVIFGIFFWQVWRQPFIAENLGHIFWLMCTVTTAIGVGLGIFFSHRTWCAFCPVGTFVSACHRNAKVLTIDNKTCISCKLCEQACPLNLSILQYKDFGVLAHQDCVQCLECVTKCPKKALHY